LIFKKTLLPIQGDFFAVDKHATAEFAENLTEMGGDQAGAHHFAVHAHWLEMDFQHAVVRFHIPGLQRLGRIKMEPGEIKGNQLAVQPEAVFAVAGFIDTRRDIQADSASTVLAFLDGAGKQAQFHQVSRRM